MKCVSCGLQNPPNSTKCDCGYPLSGAIEVLATQKVGETKPTAFEIVARIVWAFPLLSGVFAGLDLMFSWDAAKSAPQQAALAGFALAVAVIPYCIARAFAGIGGK